MEEEWLLKKAKKGDDEAFFQLFAKHKEQLYRIALSYLKNEHDVLEAIQEVAFRSYKNIRKLKDWNYFSTWLIRILINYCNDELKRKNRFSFHEIKPENARYTEEKDNRITIEMAIQELEPKLQEIIVLKYFQDLTIDQIAEQLEKPSGTIKTWLNKALKQLKKQLSKEGGYDV